MIPLPDPRQLSGAALMRGLSHLLDGQPWLRERLMEHAGRSAELDVFPVRLHLRIGPDGALAQAQEDAAPDATLRLSPLTAARLLAGDEGARSAIHLSGDPALAGALAAVLRELRWDAEEDLSRVLGDVAAHRIVAGARRAAAWQANALASVAANLAEYLGEETALLARREDVARWSQEVDALRDAVERLDKRIAETTARRGAQD